MALSGQRWASQVSFNLTLLCCVSLGVNCVFARMLSLSLSALDWQWGMKGLRVRSDVGVALHVMFFVFFLFAISPWAICITLLKRLVIGSLH